jgi:hypothetical protein
MMQIDEYSFLTARNAKKRKGIKMSYHSCKSGASLGWRSAAHPSGTVIPNETDRREVEMRNPVIKLRKVPINKYSVSRRVAQSFPQSFAEE